MIGPSVPCRHQKCEAGYDCYEEDHAGAGILAVNMIVGEEKCADICSYNPNCRAYQYGQGQCKLVATEKGRYGQYCVGKHCWKFCRKNGEF